MSIRCYLPSTVDSLAEAVHAAGVRGDTSPADHGVTPDAAGRSLRGEELEVAEYEALCIAAMLAAELSFPNESESSITSEVGPEPEQRLVIAYDADESALTEPLVDGFDIVILQAFDPARVVSVHLDDPEVWEAAIRAASEQGLEAARETLAGQDLLWYDVSELPQLLGD